MEAGYSEAAVQRLTGIRVIAAAGFVAGWPGLSHDKLKTLRGRGVA